ncbi:MAG: DUF935 family protein [Bacillota bacterium]
MTIVKISETDGFDLPPMDVEDGSAYGWFDRWNVGMTEDGNLTDYSDWEARDLWEMLKRDYKARQVDNVLTLPLMSAKRSIVPIKGDKGESEWLNKFWDTDKLQGGCETSLEQIIGLLTSAFAYKRAYFEVVWTVGTKEFAGKHIYKDVAFRPQTTCRIIREPVNGKFVGFQQEAYFIGPTNTVVKQQKKTNGLPIEFKGARAFVYTHGVHRDPLNGISDFEICFWAYKAKQRILMLWMQFLQAVSLPRTVVKANDQGTANDIAREVARLKSSGVLPVAVPGGPGSVEVSLLDAAGKGAGEFITAMHWLDQCVTQAILAGFLDLTGTAAARAGGAGGHGSYALSQDASDFFLQSLEAKTREIEDQIRMGLFAPLIIANFGPDAAIPKLQFEPLNDIDKTNALELLKQAMAAPPGGPVPVSFIAGLAEQVAVFLGLDSEQTRADFEASFTAAAQAAAAQAKAQGGPGASPNGQAMAGMQGALSAANDAVAQQKQQKAQDDHHAAVQAAMDAKVNGGKPVGPK